MKTDWKKRLKKEFFQYIPPSGEVTDEDLTFTGTLEDIEQFITQELKREREEVFDFVLSEAKEKMENEKPPIPLGGITTKYIMEAIYGYLLRKKREFSKLKTNHG